jgi:hypothetical protein
MYFVSPRSKSDMIHVSLMLVPGKPVPDILLRWLAPEELSNFTSTDAVCSARLSQLLITLLSHGH